MRRILAAVFAAFIAFATTLPSLAQSDSGGITIAVTDPQTKQPVGLAQVLLDGAVIRSELAAPRRGDNHNRAWRGNRGTGVFFKAKSQTRGRWTLEIVQTLGVFD